MQEHPPEPELPRAVALAWGVAAHPQRGPKRELSIERIVEAAIELADAEGLAAVSMSRVASALGYTTMSLYRYVTSKDDLLLLMQEAASEVPIPEAPETPDWRGGLARWVRSTRAAYREHPWLGDLPVSGVPITPNSLAMVDWFLRELRETPLDDAEKMGALLLLANYARGVSRQERELAAADPGDIDGANFLAGLAPLITPERFPDFAPFFAAGGYVGEGGSEADDFEFGLDRILDGLGRRIDERHEQPGAPQPAVAEPAPTPDEEPLPRDPRVREANRARRDAERAVREAERALRDARKRERDEVRQARQRIAEAERKAAESAAKAGRD